MGRLIDTDVLADAIQRERDLLIEREQYGAEHILVHHFERILEDVPTVDAAPVVHGRWETVPLLGGNFVSTNCSVCGSFPASRYWKYCPKCGATMDGGESDETVVNLDPMEDSDG